MNFRPYHAIADGGITVSEPAEMIHIMGDERLRFQLPGLPGLKDRA